jgi:hypothetical protein
VVLSQSGNLPLILIRQTVVGEVVDQARPGSGTANA